MGHRVRTLECGDDALLAAEHEEGVAAPVVRAGHVVDTACVLEVAVLGANAGVVEAAGARIHGGRLAVSILQQIALETVYDAFASVGHRRRVVADGGAAPERLDADQLDRVVEECGEDADRVGAAADASLHDIREVAGHLQKLLARLDAHDTLEIADHEREGMRAHDRANAVDRVLVVGQIGLKGRVDGLLECLEPAGDRHDSGAEQLHAADVRRLLLDIDLAHVDLALEAEMSCRSCEGDAMLAGAGLGDDLLLSHVLREQALAHAVVQLVGAGVVQVLALQVDLRPAVLHRQGAGVIDGCGAALEVLAQIAQLGDERRVVLDLVVGPRDLGKWRLELRREELPSVCPEEPILIGHCFPLGHLPRTDLRRHLFHLVSIVYVVRQRSLYATGPPRPERTCPSGLLSVV